MNEKEILEHNDSVDYLTVIYLIDKKTKMFIGTIKPIDKYKLM